MNKLSSITKPEHFFYTVDGNILKTTHDLFSYLSNCDQESFEHHVNSERNDFSEWIASTLLFPELAWSFKQAKSLSECKKILIEFFSAFENQPRKIEITSFFNTVDGYILKSTHELYYYINNCDDANYYHHANNQRNDFANWTKDVLGYPQLAEELYKARNRIEAVEAVKNFVTYSQYYRGGATAYNEYIQKLRSTQSYAEDNPKIKAFEQFMEYHDETPKDMHTKNTILNKQSDSEKINNNGFTNINILDNNEENKSANSIPSTHDTEYKLSQKPINTKQDAKDNTVEETIDMTAVKINTDTEDDQPIILTATFDKNGFRQYSDEELDRYIKFAKGDKEITTDLKMEYLKTCLQDLNNMIKELRRIGKDPFIATLKLKALNSKIEYYGISKSVDDYNKIIMSMKDIQKDLMESQEEKEYNFAGEIIKGLELQGMALKK